MSFIRSGVYYNGNPGDRASGGSYWQPKAISDSTAGWLNFSSVHLRTSNSNDKNLGYTLRCLVR